MGEVVITYETLFEIFRREKNRGDLQKLDDDFILNVIKYLSQKKNIINKDSSKDSLFAEEEKLKAEKQLFNIKKILRDLYELREKKIMDMAMNKSRTQSPLVDDSSLLQEEKKMYEDMVQILDKHRENILIKILKTELPQVKKEEPKELKLKFTEDTPEFAGPEMDMLGPFSKNDTEVFPKKIADILINKGCAEVVDN